MPQKVKGIESPACHLVLLEFFIIAGIGLPIGKKVVEPIKHNCYHPSPQRPTFPQVCLKLNKKVITNPDDQLLAQHSLLPDTAQSGTNARDELSDAGLEIAFGIRRIAELTSKVQVLALLVAWQNRLQSGLFRQLNMLKLRLVCVPLKSLNMPVQVQFSTFIIIGLNIAEAADLVTGTATYTKFDSQLFANLNRQWWSITIPLGSPAKMKPALFTA